MGAQSNKRVGLASALLAVCAVLALAASYPTVAIAAGGYYRPTDFVPDDPGNASVPGGWQELQWYLNSAEGIGAPAAWEHLLAAGHPGGEGVTIAVIDTGVAYADREIKLRSLRLTFKRAPDLAADRFVEGIGGPPGVGPVDTVGHGTWVVSVAAAGTDNGLALAGVAYGTRIMPLVPGDLQEDPTLAGTAGAIATDIRYAADHGAKVINMSIGLVLPNVRAKQVPALTEAIDYANSKGVVIVAATGNEGRGLTAIPARLDHVIGVGATTDSRCVAKYSNGGPGLDLVAPGGGSSKRLPGEPNCDSKAKGRGVCQQTYAYGVLDVHSVRDLRGLFRRLVTDRLFSKFKIKCFAGTSGASPLVTGTAALVIASGVLGPDPSPEAVEQRLIDTATDLGDPGYDSLYGYGLVNAAAATDPAVP